MTLKWSPFLTIPVAFALLFAGPCLADDFWGQSGGKQTTQKSEAKQDDFWGSSSEGKIADKKKTDGVFWGNSSDGETKKNSNDTDFWAGNGETELDEFMQKREEDRQAELRRIAEEKRRAEEAERIVREEERREEEEQRIAEERRERESEAESRRLQQFWKNADAERERDWNAFTKGVNDTNRAVYQEVDRINRENERKAREQERQMREAAERRNRDRDLAQQQEEDRRAADTARQERQKEERRLAEKKRLRQEEEDRERERSKQQREERLAQEKVQREEKVSALAPVKVEDGIALTWQNSKGFWFACGPIQCIQVGEKTEEEALGYVLNDNRHNIIYSKPFGRCKEYVVHGMESYDNSAEKVRRLSKCN